MVLTKKKTKTTNRVVDFKKRKVKVGRVLSKESAAKYGGVVDTTITTKKLRLSEPVLEEFDSRSEIAILKQLPLTDHHNANYRKAALSSILSVLNVLKGIPYTILARVVECMRLRIDDDDKNVRAETVDILKKLMSFHGKDEEEHSFPIYPFLDIIMLHAVTNLTAQSLGKQMHGVDISSYILDNFPRFVFSKESRGPILLENLCLVLKKTAVIRNAEWLIVANIVLKLLQEMASHSSITISARVIYPSRVSSSNEMYTETLGILQRNCLNQVFSSLELLKNPQKMAPQVPRRHRNIIGKPKNPVSKTAKKSVNTLSLLSAALSLLCLTKSFLKCDKIVDKPDTIVFPLKLTTVRHNRETLIKLNFLLILVGFITDSKTIYNYVAHTIEQLASSDELAQELFTILSKFSKKEADALACVYLKVASRKTHLLHSSKTGLDLLKWAMFVLTEQNNEPPMRSFISDLLDNLEASNLKELPSITLDILLEYFNTNTGHTLLLRLGNLLNVEGNMNSSDQIITSILAALTSLNTEAKTSVTDDFVDCFWPLLLRVFRDKDVETKSIEYMFDSLLVSHIPDEGIISLAISLQAAIPNVPLFSAETRILLRDVKQIM